jgi:hypothetical protein
MQSWFASWLGVFIAHPFGWLMLGLGCLTVWQTAAGLGRSRQWPLLPLVFGLTALAGFLVNPLADASTSQQLRAALGRQDVATWLAIVQMLLAAAAIACSLKMLDERRAGRWALPLGAVHVLPAPLLVVVLLYCEQAWLEAFVGARPEAVGRNIGLAAASLLTGAAGLAMWLPPRRLASAHLLASGTVVLVCMFVPLLPLPLPGMRLVIEPLDETARWTSIVVAVGAAAVLLGGFLFRTPRFMKHPLERKLS